MFGNTYSIWIDKSDKKQNSNSVFILSFLLVCAPSETYIIPFSFFFFCVRIHSFDSILWVCGFSINLVRRMSFKWIWVSFRVFFFCYKIVPLTLTQFNESKWNKDKYEQKLQVFLVHPLHIKIDTEEFMLEYSEDWKLSSYFISVIFFFSHSNGIDGNRNVSGTFFFSVFSQPVLRIGLHGQHGMQKQPKQKQYTITRE